MASLKQSAIQLTLKAKDLLSGVVRQSSASLSELDKKASELKAELKSLSSQDKLIRSFRSQVTATREYLRDFNEAKIKVEQLAKAQQAAVTPSKALERQLQTARRTVQQTSHEYQKNRRKLAALRTELQKNGLSNKNLSQQQKKLNQRFHQTSAAYEKVTTAAKKIRAELRRNGFRKAGNDARYSADGVRNLAASFRNLIAASLGFYAIKRAISSVLQTGDQFERLRVQMNAIMGSIEEGDRAIEWIKEFTKNTPLELQQVADAFTALKNFGLDPMDGTLQAIVDQTSKLGGGMERLNGMSLALGQAWAKQKLQGEEILQLVERGVPVWELLEKVTGKNTQELQKLSSVGKLGRETIKLLIEEIGKSSAGAAAANMSLLSGLMANMADRWTEFKDAIAQAGWLEYVKEQLSELGTSLDEMANNGRLQALAKSISDGFISMAESVRLSLSGITFENFVESTRQSFQTVSNILASLRSAFILTGSSASLFFNGFTAGIKGLGLLVSAAVARISESLAGMFDAVGADKLAAKLSEAGNAAKAVFDGFAAAIKEDVKDVNDALSSIGNELGLQNQKTQSQIRQQNQKTTDDIKQSQSELAETFRETGETGKKAFEATAEAAEKTTEAAEKAGVAGAKAGEKQAGGAQNVMQKAGGLAGFYNNLTSQLNSMSKSAENAFHAMQGATDIDTEEAQGELGELRSKLKDVHKEITHLRSVVDYDPTGIGNWMLETGKNAAYAKEQFLEQKIALEELLEGFEKGTVSAQQMASAGSAATQQMELLNQQDLDRLNSAIEQAESSMRSLSDSTRSTLEGLQNELDRLQGNTEQIQQREFESRQRQLQQQLKQAQQKGDGDAITNLQQSLSLNKQINSEKRKQIQQQQREKQQRTQPESRPEKQPASRPQRTSSPRQHDKIIRLEYPGGNVSVGINGSDESKLLEALKNAGMRSV